MPPQHCNHLTAQTPCTPLDFTAHLPTFQTKTPPTSHQKFPHFTPKSLTSATKVDATALFVKTMYVVSENNAVVYKNNAVASTLFAKGGIFVLQ